MVVQWDLSVKSREVTREDNTLAMSSAHVVAAQLANMSFGGRGAEFEAFAARLLASPSSRSPGHVNSSELVGDRHFHLTDFHVHRQLGWSVGVRMFSNRTYNAECVNAEGQISWHLADGVTTINVNGNEYGVRLFGLPAEPTETFGGTAGSWCTECVRHVYPRYWLAQ